MRVRVVVVMRKEEMDGEVEKEHGIGAEWGTDES